MNNNPYVTQYQYDALGNLLKITQLGDGSQAARVRAFSYDSFSRLLTSQNPETATITYTYDADGNVIQKSSLAPNQIGTLAQNVIYGYDGLNRITGKSYSTQGPPSSPAATYCYDSGTNGIGRLTSVSDLEGSETFTYDPLGRVMNEQRVISGATQPKQVQYSYNLDGTLASITYPSGNQLTYKYNTAGHETNLIDTLNNVAFVQPSSTTPMYLPGGALAHALYGASTTFSGITKTLVYNNRLQLCRVTASGTGAVPTTCTNSWGNLMDLSYDFHLGAGNNGNVFSITNFRDQTRNQRFTYDPLSRLTSAQNSGTDCGVRLPDGNLKFWGNTYTYDAWGNLINKTKISTACSGESLNVTANANNQLQGYAYDAAGNMTNDSSSGLGYVYDEENRLKNVAGFTYAYDANGNRIMKSNGSQGTLYWQAKVGEVTESDLSGNIQSEYMFFNGERIARRDGSNGTGGVFYYFADHLKSTSVITDSGGNIVAEYDYTPWGLEFQILKKDANHYRFNGHENDVESGLDYFGARYYSSRQGRFVSADWSTVPAPVPYADLGNPQSLNLYSFVKNNPESYGDPDGHRGEECGFVCKMSNFLDYWVWGDDAAVERKADQQRQELKKRQAERVAAGLLPLLLYSGYDLEDGRWILTSNPDLMSRSEVLWANVKKSHWDQIAALGLGYVYVASQKHIALGNAPANGQQALNNSVQVKPTSPRRVGVDVENNEIVVLDRTILNVRNESESEYHGHVRDWKELRSEMQNALIKNGLTDKRGRIIAPRLPTVPLSEAGSASSEEEH